MSIDDLRTSLQELAADSRPVDMHDRVLAATHRSQVRRTTAVGVILAVLVAGVGFITLHRTLAGTAPATVRPSPTTSNSLVPSPVVLPAYVSPPGANLGPVANATATLPSWGTSASGCATGKVRFANGQYSSNRSRPVINVLASVQADVDGDGVMESIVQLSCGEGPEAGGQQIVAFRPASGGFQPIGRIVGTQDGIAMMDTMQVRAGGQIAVQVSAQYSDSGQQYVPSQWRVYAWQSGRFRQVGGPTSFPTHPASAQLSVTVSNLVLASADGKHYTGSLSIVAKNTGDLAVEHVDIEIELPSDIALIGPGWTGCTVVGPDNTAVHCPLNNVAAHSTRTLPALEVLTTSPVAAPIHPGENEMNYVVIINQLSPYVYIDPATDPEAPYAVVVH